MIFELIGFLFVAVIGWIASPAVHLPAWLASAVFAGITVLGFVAGRLIKRFNIPGFLALLAAIVLGRGISVVVSGMVQTKVFWFTPVINLFLFAVLFHVLNELFRRIPLFVSSAGTTGIGKNSVNNACRDCKVLDTSVIIDGRIAELVETGFMTGTLIIPQFVLDELQQIADSADMIKRNRGRRGLDILNQLKTSQKCDIKISDKDFPGVVEVDSKLLELCLFLHASVVTNDFNLNKIAGLKGVPVLNINELANVMKPVVLPGEQMTISIIKEGKDHNQGVGYLDDGTMVVVDNGRALIGKKREVEVTSVFQTPAGRMIFSQIKDN